MFDLDSFVSRAGSTDGKEGIDQDGVIEFITKEEYYDVIAEPQPANNVLPDWYRELDHDMGPGLRSSTVKQCMPFLDALTMGWILTTPTEIEVEYNTKKEEINLEWQFESDPIASHNPEQLGGDNHPIAPQGVLKFNNFWAMKVPDGYSVLITSPLNRIEKRWQVFSGVVDADQYFNYVNIPFVWTGGDYHDVIPKGTPIAQAIPFKREGVLGDGEVRSLTEEEEMELKKEKHRVSTNESFYRDQCWESKNSSRMVGGSQAEE